jgi:hypothetical protein
MKKKKSVSLLVPAAGVILSMSSLSAQSISWAPASTSVPLSPASLALLAVMFLSAGSYLLYKSQNKAFRSMLSVLLVAGMFGFVKEVQAIDVRETITLTGTTGHADLTGVNHDIQNHTGIALKITLDADGCDVTHNDCDVLQAGDTCHISIDTCSCPG